MAKKHADASGHFLFALRILLGFTMFWAFLDKLFGWGFNTPAERAWIVGGSPTEGYLANAVRGPFEGVFSSLAGSVFVDWLFMLGLLGIGLAFLFGVVMRFAGYMGALMMLLMYVSAFPPETNPVVSSHILQAVLFVYLGYATYAVRYDIVRNWWRETAFAKKHPWLS